jgi:hypothetical protein
MANNHSSKRHAGGQSRTDAGGRLIPIVEPEVTHTIGLVAPQREPMTPLLTALVAEARKLALNTSRPQ